MALPSLDDYFPDWKEREALAEEMIPIIGNLYRQERRDCYCFGRALYSESVTNIMKTHRYVRQIANNELSEFESYPIMKALAELDLGPCHIDVGKLALQYMAESAGNGITPMDFVKQACAEVIGRHVPPLAKPQDVVLYGFGRIGRLLARLLIEKTGGGQQLRLRAIVVRKASKEDLVKRASLLRRDSVHGSFKGTIRVDEENNCIIANGNVIRMIYASSPAEVDYEAYGITRRDRHRQHRCVARSERACREHLKSKGAARVIVTAPGKGGIKNIVSGINSATACRRTIGFSAPRRVRRTRSCRFCKAIDDEFAYRDTATSKPCMPIRLTRTCTDNYHEKSRRGRSAPLNLVITETGASSAITDLLPALEGKLTGNAIRVPTPDVSLAILNLTVVAQDDARRSERLSARRVVVFAAAAADRLHQLARSRVVRLRRQPPRVHRRRTARPS